MIRDLLANSPPKAPTSRKYASPFSEASQGSTTSPGLYPKYDRADSVDAYIDQMQRVRKETDSRILQALTDPEAVIPAASSAQSGRKRTPYTVEEKREIERVKKARWRARKRESNSDSHHFELPYSFLPPNVWEQVKRDFLIVSNGTPIEEGLAFVILLNTIGFEWSQDGTMTQMPNPQVFDRIRDIEDI